MRESWTMFLKKEKPEFEIRPLYSIREELELIKEFCWQPKLAAGKIYTEEEIDAGEEKTGMLFWSWNGQGRKRVEDKEREMQEAGLFKR